MSGTMTSGSLPRLQQEGVKRVFDQANKAWEPIYTKIYDVDSSRKAYEVFVQTSNMGLAAVKGEGADIEMDSTKQLWTPKWIHTPYGKGFVVTREAKDDNLYGYYKKGARALAHCMNVTREVRSHILLNTAFSTSSAMTGGDGVAVCATNHPNGHGGTYSNRLPVDANFSPAALEDMLKLIMRAKDDRGLARKLMPKKLIGHTDQMFDFERVLNSNLMPGTANNDLNALRGTISGGYVLSPYMDANTKSWFIKTDAEDGLIFMNRVDIEFDEDKAFLNQNSRYAAYMRFSTGIGDVMGLFGSQGV